MLNQKILSHLCKYPIISQLIFSKNYHLYLKYLWFLSSLLSYVESENPKNDLFMLVFCHVRTCFFNKIAFYVIEYQLSDDFYHEMIE